MYYMSAQGVDEHAINAHYYYYMHAYRHMFTQSFLMYMFTPSLSHLGWSINIKTCFQNYFASQNNNKNWKTSHSCIYATSSLGVLTPVMLTFQLKWPWRKSQPVLTKDSHVVGRTLITHSWHDFSWKSRTKKELFWVPSHKRPRYKIKLVWTHLKVTSFSLMMRDELDASWLDDTSASSPGTTQPPFISWISFSRNLTCHRYNHTSPLLSAADP